MSAVSEGSVWPEQRPRRLSEASPAGGATVCSSRGAEAGTGSHPQGRRGPFWIGRVSQRTRCHPLLLSRGWEEWWALRACCPVGCVLWRREKPRLIPGSGREQREESSACAGRGRRGGRRALTSAQGQALLTACGSGAVWQVGDCGLGGRPCCRCWRESSAYKGGGVSLFTLPFLKILIGG